MAVICGLFFEKSQNRMMIFAGLVLGSLVNYLFGTAWLAVQTNLTFYQALWAGVIPYIPGDLVKILLAVFLAPELKSRVQGALDIHPQYKTAATGRKSTVNGTEFSPFFFLRTWYNVCTKRNQKRASHSLCCAESHQQTKT